MHKRPLILSPHWDIGAAAVRWGLVKNGINPVWSASLAESAIGPLTLYGSDQSEWRMRSNIDGSWLSSVWFRRPRKPKEFPMARACDAECLRMEWSLLHDNVYALSDELSNVLWINTPAASKLTENKLVQLRVARQCGLRFPETLVSNNPIDIRHFINKHGRVVYKGFSRYTWKQASSGRMFAQWVNTLDSGTELDDASLALCPGVYQPYVDKKCDVRVTVVGDQVFAIQLSSGQGDGLVDWRQHALTEKVQAHQLTLPDAYQCKLKQLMQRLGIVYGCIDLVIDADDQIYFLEVNQAGEFLFVEELVDCMPMLQAMCAMLATGRTDYSLEALSAVSYREYLDSESFAEWHSKVKDDMHADTRVILE